MPIYLPFPIRNLSESEFDEIDRIVMDCAHASQRELGLLCDERDYENDIASRLAEQGMTDVHAQVPVILTHDGFSKTYRFDLLVHHALYELKTVAALTKRHDAQALQYGMLAGINHVKLLNFLSGKVQGKLRYNTLTHADRRCFTWEAERWKPVSSRCADLKGCVTDLIKDWGTCLEASLYEEALVHFFGGESPGLKPASLASGGNSTAPHLISSHSEGVAFTVTESNSPDTQREQLRRRLRINDLRAIQWLNLSHRTLHLETLTAA